MRRLLRLSLEGFKTFSGRTDLDLGPGLTAIVGPNGSGKSNLIDAIAWAVGDRSWKSLRGEGMDDLLFHGDDRHPAANRASVTLSFANEDRLLGIDFSEVTVLREIRRGEGTKVALNGVEAKLKDVQSVLSGTGLAGGFSLIRQGTVDKFILSGPEDVARWLEESANIAGYRARKREAVERLKKVEATATEAERRNASLRRELVQVRERAARVRTRRALEQRRDQLRALRTAWEGRRLDEALASVTSGEARIRGRLAELARERQGLAECRFRLEQELAGDGESAPAGTSRLKASELAGTVRRIGAAAEHLQSTADRLRRDGPAGWPGALQRLDQAAGMLRDLQAPRAALGPRLQDLRTLSARERDLEHEERREAADLTAHQCERARLEERRASLGAAAGGTVAVPASLDPDRVQKELDAAECELSGIGPVDETAEAREREIAAELESLRPVLEDLAASWSKLGAFIRQLETYTAQIFEETRVAVEARFRRYCALLFEGGDARLAILDSDDAADDVLEAGPPGVEVRVRLPRKPELPLTLLSGGERSLAGIALVLALAAGDGSGRLLILDEVDAALDEGNAARLARLLRELQEQHQILCVTHNKVTMHQASHLVGVTSGVASTSTLLKVRLEGLDRNSPAA